MRVTIVSPYDPAPPTAQEAAEATVGGVEHALLRMAEEVAARGHEVTLLCSTAGPSRPSWEGDLRVVRVHRRGALLRAPLVDLAAHLPREADVVHVPATYPFTTPPVLRAAHRAGQAAVLDFHFEPDPGFALGRAAAAVYRHLGPRAYPLADAVVVRSRAYARSAPSLRAVPESRWRVVPNGVDARRFRAQGPRAPGDYLLVVGRLVPYKGVATLLRALARLPDAPPLRIAGDGPLRKELMSLAGTLRVDAQFLGRVPDAALPALYRGARLTVLPSVNGQEAFGIALLESMACGTPVVASALPGVAEVAAEGGVTAPPGDDAALARVLAEALEQPLPRGEALAQRIRARYDWPVVAERLVAVYEEVLAPRSRGAPKREVVRAARARHHPVG
jgi:glycosyltransferase involved in cell wall biosynthesis